MKKVLLLLTLLLSLHIQAQVVNQVTVLPASPTSTDTLYVITNFSYFGNCSFGLVGYTYYVQDSTIHILNTYCGFGDTTWCTSIDTLKLETFPVKNYTLSIEFHQGSICPFSHFDTTLALYDTTLIISATSGIEPIDGSESEVIVFPNPAVDELNVQLKNRKIDFIELYDSFGVVVGGYSTSTFTISNLSTGFYGMRIYSGDTSYFKKIIIR
jgi:hypothetical protein